MISPNGNIMLGETVHCQSIGNLLAIPDYNNMMLFDRALYNRIANTGFCNLCEGKQNISKDLLNMLNL